MNIMTRKITLCEFDSNLEYVCNDNDSTFAEVEKQTENKRKWEMPA